MKLALIGADEESLAFLQAVLAHGDHELVAAHDIAEWAGFLGSMAPGVRVGDDWEELLLGSRADLVIVSRGTANLEGVTGVSDAERRADQLRKLAQAAIPLLVFVPACEAIIGYEVEMIRRDSGGFIFPYIPRSAEFAALEQLASAEEADSLSEVEQLVIERQLEPRSRPRVLLHLTRDASLMRRLMGQINKVTATGPQTPIGRDPLGPKVASQPSLANLTVHLQGQRAFSGRWSVGPVTTEPGAKVSLLGGAKENSLWIPDRASTASKGRAASAVEVEDARGVLAELQAIQAGRHRQAFTWLSACRDQEVTEAVDRSLARGRTIELFNEEHTEEQSFKGVMAMGGCLLLALALGMVLLAAIVEGLQLPIRGWAAWKWWPAYLLVPTVLFLLMQLLQLAIKRGPANIETPERP